MPAPPHHDSSRAVLRILRRQRLLIALVVVTAVVGGIAYSVLKTPIYVASAALGFKDEGQDLDLLGAVVAAQPNPDKLAASKVSTATSAAVLRLSERRLAKRGSPLAASSLQGQVSAHVDLDSNLVVVEARDQSPVRAAQIANAVAEVDANVQNRIARRNFSGKAQALEDRLKLLKTEGGAEGGPDSATTAIYESQISRLQALGQIARPAEVVRAAVEPTAPDSPRPVRDTLLAAFLGLLLGAGAALARESLDRRLHSSLEIQEYLNLPVIGNVRERAMGQPPGSLDGSRVMDDQDVEGFRILRSNMAFLNVDNPPRSVVITSALPEEGKSTVAASLAHASAAAGTNTLLLECDLRRPTLAGRLGLAAVPGLADYLAGTEGDVIQDVPGDLEVPSNGDDVGPFQPHARLSCITAGTRSPQPAEILGSERFRVLLTELTASYELVVIDSAPLLSVVDTRELIPLVEAVFVCVRVARTTRDQISGVKAALERFPPRPGGAIITGLRHQDELDYGYYSYAY